MKIEPRTLTEEEKAAGVTLVKIPLEEMVVVDISDKKIEQMARGFIMGSQAIGRRKEVRELLEEKVIKKIGKKGKYLTDKLFELIEGVYVIDKRGGKDGMSIRYYQVPPNLNAIIYALDRVLGKPKQFTEHTEEKTGLILVEHVIRNLANNPYRKNENGVGRNINGELGDGNAVVGGNAGAVAERLDIRVGAQPI